MVTRQEIERALRALGLGERSHVLVHASYKAIGGVDGGPATVARALVESLATVMMPAFTSERTSAWDAGGVFEGNAYRPVPPADFTPEAFTYRTPIDKGIGVIAEAFRTMYPVRRTANPWVSFIASGELADELCGPGTEVDGVEPVRRLMDAGGDLLLLGVTHTSSTSVHLAEQLAGRPLFLRHALTPNGVRAVRAGGCGDAFDALQPHVERLERRATLDGATLRCYALASYVEAARQLIEREPLALLCDSCDRCRAHRGRVPV
ncbi:MAG: AAC(3) family N-acetyltransferase [Chloroflexi bacterium]|nr:AAC(3) family N-acetyltransferase [Chloroflexota bacterium]